MHSNPGSGLEKTVRKRFVQTCLFEGEIEREKNYHFKTCVTCSSII